MTTDCTIQQTEKLHIVPANSSSAADFDFLAGKWNIRNRKLKDRLNGCNDWEEFNATGEMEKILTGLGNTDSFITTINGRPFEGRTFRLFNPLTRLWSIYWADSESAVLDTPVVGSFNQDLGTFYTNDVYRDQSVLVKFHWDKSQPDSPVWSQAFSINQGETWEWNWYMYFERSQ